VPSEASVNNFKLLTLENSLPFSYIYDMGNLYDEAFNQSADTFILTIPFGSGSIDIISTAQLEALSFQPLVRTIMGAMCLFLTALFVYKKIIKIHDQNHQTV